MSADGLLTDVEVAERLQIDDLGRFHRLRREKGWPCVKLGRFVVRFTPEQYAQIVAMQSVAAGSRGVGGQGSGLTKGSRSRGAK